MLARNAVKYRHNKIAIYKHLFNKAESVLGLGAILWFAVGTKSIRPEFAWIVFALLTGVFSSGIKGRLEKIRALRLSVEGGELVVDHGGGDTRRYRLAMFSRLTFTRGWNGSVNTFKLHSTDTAVKLQHFENIDRLYTEISQFIPEIKEVRWWWPM